jgi:hypothetical protein
MDSTTGIVLLLVLAVVFFVVKGKDKKVKPKSVPSKAKPKAPTVA